MTAFAGLHDAQFIDKNGNPQPTDRSWKAVPYLDTHECRHAATICDDCIRSWLTDFDVRIE